MTFRRERRESIRYRLLGAAPHRLSARRDRSWPEGVNITQAYAPPATATSASAQARISARIASFANAIALHSVAASATKICDRTFWCGATAPAKIRVPQLDKSMKPFRHYFAARRKRFVLICCARGHVAGTGPHRRHAGRHRHAHPVLAQDGDI
jgi:hypothetical protein